MYSLQLSEFIKKRGLWLASALAVILIFQICYGLEILIPTNVSWLMTVLHDWGQHYLGFLFFRNEPWHFPIGHINNLYHPLGTNIGYTDSIPLLGIIFKLFDPILPEDFQYFGIWLFLCHLLAAYYTILLFRLFRVKDIYTFFAVIFIAANPVLVYRGLHPALCGHWLFLASVYLYFLHPGTASARKILLYQFIILMISGLVNPYICFMVLGFTLVIPLKLCFFDKAISRKHMAIYLFASIFFLLLAWYAVGLLTFGSKEDIAVRGGYGLYAMNLNSLYNPWGFSSIIPDLKKVSLRQYEGFMYLGVGFLLLLLAALVFWTVSLVKKERSGQKPVEGPRATGTNLAPLLFLIAAYALFAITHVITFNDKVLFTVPIPEWLIRFGEIFRASARFFWIPYYILIFFTLIAVAKSRYSHLVKISLFAVALLLQFYDTKRLLTFRDLTYGSYEPPIDTKNWNALIKEFDEIIFYPPFEANNLSTMDYQYFCYLAAKARKPINTGYVARNDYKGMKKYHDSLDLMLENATIPPRTLFITTPAHLNNFSLALQTEACRLNILDRYYYLYSKQITDKNLLSLSNHLNAKDKHTFDSALTAVERKIYFTDTNGIRPEAKKDSAKFAIEKFYSRENYVSLDGWAFPEIMPSNDGDSIFFTLSGSKSYTAPAFIRPRPDVNSYYNKPDLKNVGFNGHIFTEKVEKGKYKLGIAIKKADGTLIHSGTDKILKIGVPDFVIPQKTNTVYPVNSNRINANFEEFTADKNCFNVSGWAYLTNQSTDDLQINLILKKGNEQFIVETEPVTRPDISEYFKSPYNLDKAGFTVKFSKELLPQGKYQVGILINDKKRNKNSLLITDKEIKAL